MNALWLLLFRGGASPTVVKPTCRANASLPYTCTARALVDGSSVMRANQGQLVTLDFSFDQSSGDAFDPTAVKASVRRPGGKVRTYVYGTDAELVKDSTGRYHLNLLCHLSGLWHYRGFTDTSGQECADEQQIVVIPAQAVSTP